MAILRIKKHVNRFVTLQTAVLNIETLSWEAKGLWAYLMARPDNWAPSVSHLTTHFPSKKDKLYKLFHELEKHGLCNRYQERLETGKMGSFIYTIYEEPSLNNGSFCEQPQQENPPAPLSGKPVTEFPLAVDPPLIKNEYNKERTKVLNENIKKKDIKEKDPSLIETSKSSPEKERFGELQNVRLTQAELSKLKEKFGEKKTLEWIDRLDLYLAQKGDRYKSHYATILSWSKQETAKEGKFQVAYHRRNSKLAFETEKDTWKPKFLNAVEGS